MTIGFFPKTQGGNFYAPYFRPVKAFVHMSPRNKINHVFPSFLSLNYISQYCYKENHNKNNRL